MAGYCSESINPRSFEDLPELFYEECVSRSPHIALAETCFQRYEQRVYFAFTRSAGTRLPRYVKQKLAELRTNAYSKAPILHFALFVARLFAKNKLFLALKDNQ